MSKINGVRLRVAGADDVSAVVEAAVTGAVPPEVMPPDDAPDPSVWTPERKRSYADFLRSRLRPLDDGRRETSLLVLVDDRIAGMVRLLVTPDDRDAVETGMWLVRDVRGRGVARRVLSLLAERARSAGARRLVADTTTTNVAALATLRGGGADLSARPADSTVDAVLHLLPATVREYVAADRPAVVALSLRAWAPVFDSIREALCGSGVYELQYPDGWTVAQTSAVGAACDDPSLDVLVAVDDGRVAGFVATRLHDDDHVGEIHMIAVDPEYQRRGMAADLTGAALDRMRHRGMTSTMVETGGDPGHAPARATYEAAGFHPMPIVRYFRTLPG